MGANCRRAERLGRKGLWVGSGAWRQDGTLRARTLDPDRERNARTLKRTHTRLWVALLVVSRTNPRTLSSASRGAHSWTKGQGDAARSSPAITAIFSSSLFFWPFVPLQCIPLDWRLPWQAASTKERDRHGLLSDHRPGPVRLAGTRCGCRCCRCRRRRPQCTLTFLLADEI